MMQSANVQRSRGLAGALVLALVASALLIFSGSANATTFTPNDGPALQAAIISANSNPGRDTILLNDAASASTQYFPDLPMTISDDLTIKKGGKVSSTFRAFITGQNVNPRQADLFTIDAGVNVLFDTVTVTAGADFGFGVFHNFGNLTIARSVISGNSGNDLLNEAGGTLLVNNSTVSDNVTSGALFNNGGDVTFNNATVLRHPGGGLASAGGTLTVNNTVVAENAPNCSAAVDVTVASLDDDGTCGVALSGVPAQLGPVQNNGGSSNSSRPAATSPVINAGNNAICPTVDQRYFVRSDAGCDIGAFEVGSAADTTLPTCVVTALRAGPPKQQDVTAQDSGSGLASDAITNVAITNGTVAFTPFTAPSRLGLVLTATKTNQAQVTQWSFTATDLAGNVKNCA